MSCFKTLRLILTHLLKVGVIHGSVIPLHSFPVRVTLLSNSAKGANQHDAHCYHTSLDQRQMEEDKTN